MKKVILIAFAFVLLACGAVGNENGASACDNGGEQGCTLEDSSTIKQELTDQKPFEKTNITTVFTMLENKESGIVYFGFSDCPWCQEALPILKQVLEEQKLNCYYVQTRDEERNSLLKEEEKADIMEKSMDFLQRDEENNPQLYVPFVIVIEEGKVIDGHVGTVEGYDTNERKMNKEEKEEVKKQIELYKSIRKVFITQCLQG